MRAVTENEKRKTLLNNRCNEQKESLGEYFLQFGSCLYRPLNNAKLLNLMFYREGEHYTGNVPFFSLTLTPFTVMKPLEISPVFSKFRIRH